MQKQEMKDLKIWALGAEGHYFQITYHFHFDNFDKLSDRIQDEMKALKTVFFVTFWIVETSL